jgi:ABC-type multidrug transport system fused ATPase/permease subunit
MAIYLKTAQGIGLAICLMQGAANLHNSAVSAVMKSPMAFFDTTPVGRIINRFSKDLDDSKHLFVRLIPACFFPSFSSPPPLRPH